LHTTTSAAATACVDYTITTTGIISAITTTT
jgi:hypothetical protein